MILALILATLNQISSPEESIVDDRPVLTALSFRHFPSPESVAARKRFYHGRRTIYPVHGSKVPTLVELLLNRIRTNPDTPVPNLTNPREIEKHRKKMTFVNQLEQIRLGEILRVDAPFYFHYDTEQFIKERVQRRKMDPGPRVVYLTSATLVIVPPNLLGQWHREIQKHCDYPLRVLILRPKTRLPPASSLASDFDVSRNHHASLTGHLTRTSFQPKDRFDDIYTCVIFHLKLSCILTVIKQAMQQRLNTAERTNYIHGISVTVQSSLRLEYPIASVKHLTFRPSCRSDGNDW